MSGDNRMTQCLLSCLSCIVACFERFVEFLNRNAYIQIALTGKSFCPAAKDAFESIWSNATRYSLVSGMGEIFTFVINLLIFSIGWKIIHQCIDNFICIRNIHQCLHLQNRAVITCLTINCINYHIL